MTRGKRDKIGDAVEFLKARKVKWVDLQFTDLF